MDQHPSRQRWTPTIEQSWISGPATRGIRDDIWTSSIAHNCFRLLVKKLREETLTNLNKPPSERSYEIDWNCVKVKLVVTTLSSPPRWRAHRTASLSDPPSRASWLNAVVSNWNQFQSLGFSRSYLALEVWLGMTACNCRFPIVPKSASESGPTSSSACSPPGRNKQRHKRSVVGIHSRLALDGKCIFNKLLGSFFAYLAGFYPACVITLPQLSPTAGAKHAKSF